MRVTTVWTKDMEKYIIDNYGKKTMQQMSEDLLTRERTVWNKVMQLKKAGKIKGRNATENYIREFTNNDIKLKDCKHSFRVGEKVSVEATNLSINPKDKYEGEVVYAGECSITVKTDKYNVSISTVDIVIGLYKVRRVN